MIPLKVASLVIGAGTTTVLTLMQTAAGETLTQSLEHGIVAGAFAVGGAFILLKETRRRVDRIEEQLLPELRERLDRQDRTLSDINRDVGELVGEVRARRKRGETRTRADDHR